MRVLFVSSEYPPAPGSAGIGTFVAGVARALVRQGHEVHVLSCVRGGPRLDEIDEGVHVHRRRAFRLRGLGALLRNEALAARVRAITSAAWHQRRLDLRPDVLELPDWLAEGLLARRRSAQIVVQLHGCLRVIQEHDGTDRRLGDRLADRLERIAVRRADLIVSPSKPLATKLHADGWLRHDARVAVVPHGIDLDAVAGVSSVAPVGTTEPVVLCVSKLTRLKGVDAVVRAAALLNDVPGARTVVVGGVGGESGYARAVRGEAEAAGTSVAFVGELQRHQVDDHYRGARVVVVPSRFEAFSMVALEAMARGRPVACGPNTGAAAIVGEVAPSLVVDVGDPEAIAAAVRPLLRDPTLAQELGEACRDAVAARCRIEAVVRRRLEAIDA